MYNLIFNEKIILWHKNLKVLLKINVFGNLILFYPSNTAQTMTQFLKTRRPEGTFSHYVRHVDPVQNCYS